MPSLAYLTVPDVLWLSLRLTGERVPFDNVALEEAVFYQYAYGDSDEVVAQAARLLEGFVAKRPFDRGNEAVALVATAAFLAMNGLTMGIDPRRSAVWAKDIWSGEIRAADALASSTKQAETDVSYGIPSAQAALAAALSLYGPAAAELLEDEPLAPLA